MNEARWPNSSLDVSHPTWAYAQGATETGGTTTLTDPQLTQPDGFWNGATVIYYRGMVAYFDTVSNYTPGKLTFQQTHTDDSPNVTQPYMLVGILGALDTGGEWSKDASGFYLWTPQNDNPSNHTVEVKKRAYGFDLSGKSNVTIKDINLFATGMNTDLNSRNDLIEGISAKYTTHFLSHGWDPGITVGLILLSGSINILQNC